MSYAIRLQSNPNNETRITLYPIRNKRVESLNVDSEVPFASTSAGLPSGERSDSDQLPSPYLDIRSEFRTKCSAMSYPRTKFGLPAVTRILRAAGACDRHDSNPQHYLFLTATLPGNDELAKWAIADGANDIIDRLKSWLSKKLPRRHEFYVWEHQKRSALHLHYCIYVPDAEGRAWIKDAFRHQWVRLLDNCGNDRGCSLWGKYAGYSFQEKVNIVQTKVEEVYSSVGAYFAGYLADGGFKHKDDNKHPYYPKRWFGVSRNLSAIVKEHTKEEKIEYPNYRVAKLSFDEFNREFEQEEIKGKIWCHTVGRGETGVHYHTPKIQLELWLARKTMQYKRSQFPNTAFMISTALKILVTCSELEIGSQWYRKNVSSSSRNVLQDSLYKDSLRRGILRDVVVQAIETMFLDLSCNLSLPLTVDPLLKNVRVFAQMHSENYHWMRWNRYGYLAIDQDLPNTVDTRAASADSGTSTAEVDAKGRGVDSSSGLVPGEDTPHLSQLVIF